MNLIEKYGSYDAAKAKQQELSKIAADPQLLLVGKIIKEIGEIEIALLEYRRQHNIFEVGDKVVLAQFHSLDTVHEIKRIENLTPHIKGSETTYFLENSLGCWSFQIKHADDAEIKAGKRLEVNDGN